MEAEKHLRTHSTWSLEVDGLQKKKTTSGLVTVSQEQGCKPVMGILD